MKLNFVRHVYWIRSGDCVNKEMFEEWVCGCDNCQDVGPHNRMHDWNEGEDFSNLKEIAVSILPENYDNLSDEYLIQQVIPKTAGHLQVSDVNALRKNAKRATSYADRGLPLN